MMRPVRTGGGCPVVAYERADEGYVECVGEWLANPYAFFKSFGPEARAFQARHRSERLRTMTLVAPAEKLAVQRPVCLSVDGTDVPVETWEQVFAVVVSRLMAAQAHNFVAMQADGWLEWLGCPVDGTPAAELLAADALRSEFSSLDDVVARVQWLFLMCGIRLNEVIVQVDPYTDAEWVGRKSAIDRRRAVDKAFMDGRRAAQKAWAERNAQWSESLSGMDGSFP